MTKLLGMLLTVMGSHYHSMDMVMDIVTVTVQTLVPVWHIVLN